MKQGIKKLIAVCLAVLLLCSTFFGNFGVQAASKDGVIYVARKADIVFAIDATGSMGYVIKGVKENLTEFVSSLKEEEGIDLQIRFAIYRDITCGEATELSDWFTDPDTAIAYLDGVDATGGGDGPETLFDAWGAMLDGGFRADAAKFCISLTDANYKLDNDYGFTTVDEVKEALTGEGIHNSIVTRTAYFSLYNDFITGPSTADSRDGGVLADIEGDYSVILLEDFRNAIIDVLDDNNAVKIQSTMIVLKKGGPDAEYLIEGGTPQDSCVFKDLEPDTEYTFIVREDGKEKRVTLRTEKATGAQIGKIPQYVYEGEVYQIRPNEDIKKMMETPDAEITWSSASDCLKVTPNKVGNGCEMIVYDCKYNTDKLLKVSLVADVEHSVKQSNGTYKKASKRVQQSFYVKNDIDALDVGAFHGTTDNIYETGLESEKNGMICLTTKDKVWVDIIFNQGDKGDVASVQTLTYFISDKYGYKNARGTKIARVDAKGNISGVAPGVTYVTIAAKDSYNKYSKEYKYSVTIPIVCPHVNEVGLDTDALCSAMGLDKKYVGGSSSEYIYLVERGKKINLAKYILYNPENVFNKNKIRCTWSSMNTSVAKISSKGVVTFNKLGDVTIYMTPTGGYEIDATTGRAKIESKPCSISFRVVGRKD